MVDVFASHDTRPLRCQGLSPDALFDIAKRYAKKLAEDSKLTEAVRNGNANLVTETIQQLENEKARADYDDLDNLLTMLDTANHTSPIQWEPAGITFAVMPAFSSNVDIQRNLLAEFNCDSSAEFFGKLLRLGFEDVEGDNRRWRHPYFQRHGRDKLKYLELFQQK